MYLTTAMRELHERLRAGGADMVGFADLTVVPAGQRFGFPRAVSFGLALPAQIVAAIAGGPTAEYEATYRSLNHRLTRLARETAGWLRSAGWQAQAQPSTGDIDWESLQAPFSHKMAATLAGLGWIGKCDLLITREFGGAVRWATVLTDAPLDCGKPITESHCGRCLDCAEVCPGHAITGKLWRQGVPREEFWDARACLAGIRKIATERGLNSPICGMCIAACPFTRAYVRRAGQP